MTFKQLFKAKKENPKPNHKISADDISTISDFAYTAIWEFLRVMHSEKVGDEFLEDMRKAGTPYMYLIMRQAVDNGYITEEEAEAYGYYYEGKEYYEEMRDMEFSRGRLSSINPDFV